MDEDNICEECGEYTENDLNECHECYSMTCEYCGHERITGEWVCDSCD